ncbi:chemotaxis protein CheX [Litorivivens sp.]|uniref:chemotaxis protein CheX n=1 Tax=Litorivivens sp. TaxID=2020868 RepID=UPI003565679B
MTDENLQVFIDSVVNYFACTAEGEVKVGTPFLDENQQPTAFDFTGIIGISGPRRGCVYFTAPRALLRHLLLSLGESDTELANLLDIVGEVANTISGNARGNFGKEFMISVPVVVQGAPESIHVSRKLRSYVIPIYWKAYSAAVVISLER